MSSRFYTGFSLSLRLKTNVHTKGVFHCSSTEKSFWGDKKRFCRLRQSEGYGSGLEEPVSRSLNLRANSMEPRRPADRIKSQTMVGSLGGPDSRRRERRLLKPLQ